MFYLATSQSALFSLDFKNTYPAPYFTSPYSVTSQSKGSGKLGRETSLPQNIL